MDVGNQIRERRQALRLSQEELAQRLYVSRVTVSHWETGRTLPDVQSMLLLANLWMVPLYHPLADKAEFERRAAVLVRVMHALGVDLVDWESFDPTRMWDDSWGELARDLAGEGAAKDGGDSPR